VHKPFRSLDPEVEAVRNAIADAVGVRLTSIPFTPEKILHALGVVSA
jgi:CO/xanthine dehydrogenase Mo-binding subunit